MQELEKVEEYGEDRRGEAKNGGKRRNVDNGGK